MLVFLQPAVLERTRFVDRVGAGIGRSGTGRPYVGANYPVGQRDSVLHALHRWKPAALPVRAWKVVHFDRKRRVDATQGERG